MPQLDIVIETQKNIKEKKLYPVRNRPFHPNLSVKPLTGKFYAKHNFIHETVDYTAIEEAIKRKQASKPKDRSPDPETVNQTYGWYTDPLLPMDRSDTRFYHPRHYTWITVIGSAIEAEAQKVPRKPFAGVPFKF